MRHTRLAPLGLATALALASVLALGALAADADDGPFTGPVEDRSTICMMQDSVQPRPGLDYEHEGKHYFLCCAMCEEKFKESPASYTHATDPVSGVKVDKAEAPIYAYQGRAFFFESKANLEKFAAAPAQYLRAHP